MTDDPFATLGVERRFDLDLDALQQAFFTATSASHPDRFSDPVEQAEAVQAMAGLTGAYQTLRDPESRARALLALSGLESDVDRDKLPPDLLMEVMEVREEMEQAVATNDTDELARLRRWAEQRQAQHLAELKDLFAGGLGAGKAARVRLELNALRYMRRMLEQMP